MGVLVPNDVLEDDAVQAAVLMQVLALHPDQLTFDELRREMTGDADQEFAERDAFERAVRDLAGAGLLRREGESVLPTRAAIRFWALAER